MELASKRTIPEPDVRDYRDPQSNLPVYIVEHCRGVAGIDEQTVEKVIVNAESESAAIKHVTDWHSGQNPESTQGGSGRYNDYWFAALAECPCDVGEFCSEHMADEA